MIHLLAALFACFLMLVGAGFSLIAAIGIVRMPDLYTRMQAAAKTATLGVGCTILAVAIHFAEVDVTTGSALVIMFLFLTAPVAAHMISRAGYISGVKLWDGSVTDELSRRYDRVTHELASGETTTGDKTPEDDRPPEGEDS